MQLQIDTGSVEEVREFAAWGVLSGATTNPTLLAKEQGDPSAIVREICEVAGGPVSVEVVSTDAEGMVAEGRGLARLHEQVVVKIPCSQAGLSATRALTDEGIRTNVTLIFSPTQALLAAEAGATFLTCFMGRLDDISIDAGEVLREIVESVAASTAQVLAASLRHPVHVVTAARLGCDAATVPPKVMKQMLVHPLTEAGIDKFAQDWSTRPDFAKWLQELPAARAA